MPVVAPPDPGPAAREQLSGITELAALLAAHPAGVSRAHAMAALWPDRGAAEEPQQRATERFDEYLVALREWMGITASGADALSPVAEPGTCPRLHPDVVSDWAVWQQLVNQHPFYVSTERLQAALDLVRGRPFEGGDTGAYAWAAPLRADMIAAICDSAEELASRHIRGARAAFDLELALQAAHTGLALDDAEEGLWRMAIVATHFGSGEDATDRARQLIDAMMARLDEDGLIPDEETQELLGRLA